MNKLKQILTNKKFIYGSGSFALISGFIVIMVIINLIAGVLVDKFSLKIDLTENKIFELSDETKELLKAVSVPIDITYFVEDVNTTEPTREILERFANENKNLKLQLVDPAKNPTLSNKYTSINQKISYGSIVFDSGKNFKVVGFDQLTADNPLTKQEKSILVAESKFASAIISVTREKSSVVALVQGHGEKDITATEQILKDENFKVEKFNIASNGFKDEYDMVIVASPQTDFSADEIKAFDDYLKKGKNAQIYFDIQTEPLPKLEGYISDWGVSVGRDLVLEGDPQKVLGNVPYNIIPKLKSHGITDAIISNNLTIGIPLTRSVTPIWEAKNGIEVQSIMSSSEKSYAKVNIESDKITKEENDKSGPISLMAIATLNTQNSKPSNLLITGTSMFIDEQMLDINRDLFVNGIVWMTNHEDPLSIAPKSLMGPTLKMNQLAISLWMIFVVGVIPLIVLLAGFTVWLRRKNL